MLGVGGFSLSLGRAGEGGGGSRGGGHLSRRMLLLERPFLPRFLHKYKSGNSCYSTSEDESVKEDYLPNRAVYSKNVHLHGNKTAQ